MLQVLAIIQSLSLTIPTCFALAAALVAFGLFPLRVLLERKGIVDRPNARSSHLRPTVRGGGVAIVAVMIVAIGWTEGGWPGLVLMAATAILAVVSFIDDVNGVPATVRLGFQSLASIAAIVALTDSTHVFFGLGFVALAWLWLTGYTNAFNFMDGINGLAGLQALIAGLGTAVVAVAAGLPASSPPVLLAIAVSGAALGFLPHNFPRARVFMGDVGSAPLGFILASLAVWIACLSSWWMLFWVALLHANFVLDTGITLIRRAVRRERLLDAHREHFYQRLVRSGWSHTRTSLTVALLQALAVFALAISTTAGTSGRAAAAVGIGGMWLLFFWFAETRFRGFDNSKLAA